MKTKEEIIEMYAHDFRDIAMKEEKLQEYLKYFVREITPIINSEGREDMKEIVLKYAERFGSEEAIEELKVK